MKKRYLVGGVAVAAAVLTGAGVAVAASTAPPSNIYGCVSGANRALTGVYTVAGNFKGCPKGSFAVSVTSGKQGPPGVASVQADEPYGSNVDPNANVTQSPGTVPAGQTAVIWAACPSGKVALGGGFRVGDGTAADAAESDSTGSTYAAPDMQVLASEPSFEANGTLSLAGAPLVTSYGSYLPNAWAVTVHNSGTADNNARVAVICAKVAS